MSLEKIRDRLAKLAIDTEPDVADPFAKGLHFAYEEALEICEEECVDFDAIELCDGAAPYYPRRIDDSRPKVWRMGYCLTWESGRRRP